MAITVAQGLHPELTDIVARATCRIFEECERAIGLQEPNVEFRDALVSAVNACLTTHCKSAEPELVFTRVYRHLPKAAVRASRRRGAVIVSLDAGELRRMEEMAQSLHKDDELRLGAFHSLVKRLALAFCDATGRRPAITFNHDHRRLYGPFWRRLKITLPLVEGLAEPTGTPFTKPATDGAIAASVKQTLRRLRETIDLRLINGQSKIRER